MGLTILTALMLTGGPPEQADAPPATFPPPLVRVETHLPDLHGAGAPAAPVTERPGISRVYAPPHHYQQPPRASWPAPGAVRVETLVRATYELPPDRARALSGFLKQHVGAAAETRLDDDGLTVTASAEVQRTVGQFIALMSKQPAAPSEPGCPTAVMFGVGVDSDAGVVGSIVCCEQNFDVARNSTCRHDTAARCTDGAPLPEPQSGRILQRVAYEAVPLAPAASEAPEPCTVELALCGADAPPTVWEVTTTGVNRVAGERTAGGLRITLPASAGRAAILVTDNPILIEKLQEGIRKALPPAYLHHGPYSPAGPEFKRNDQAEAEPFVPPAPLP